MDSQHRHELEENDLSHFLTHFGKWWNRWGNMFLTVVLVVVASIAVKRWVDKNAVQAHDAAQAALAEASTPEAYQEIARSYNDPAVQAVAYLRGADLLLADAAGVRNAAAQTQPASETTREANLKKARQLYEAAIAIQDVAPLVKANARIGLGTAYEQARDWKAAREQYEKAAEEVKAVSPVIAAQAKARIVMLPRLSGTVVFAASQPEPPVDKYDPRSQGLGAPMDVSPVQKP